MKKSIQTGRQTDIPRLCFSLSAWLGSLVQDTAGDRTLDTCHSATVAATTTTTTTTDITTTTTTTLPLTPLTSVAATTTTTTDITTTTTLPLTTLTSVAATTTTTTDITTTTTTTLPLTPLTSVAATTTTTVTATTVTTTPAVTLFYFYAKNANQYNSSFDINSSTFIAQQSSKIFQIYKWWILWKARIWRKSTWSTLI